MTSRAEESDRPGARAADPQRAGLRLEVRGTVQGVGFRPWVYRLAREEALGGRVFNHSQGVTIEAFGPAEALRRFEGRLRGEGPPAARLDDLETAAIAFEELPGFLIVESQGEALRRVSIPPDLATCDDCLREVFDPADRRHLYPFTNCTNCGPRFTIARDVPYDRAATTMAGFTMCATCQAEYNDPANRRFHAQPNACPTCGPRLALLDPQGASIAADDPLALAAQALIEGGIVAVKGIGGFHLACAAGNPAAVRELRRRKHRDAKPFAVMARDLAACETLAALHDHERGLLTSVVRPIVLVERRPQAPLAAEIAPDSPLLGLMLPYSPLHHLLLAATGCPLVLTSGNLADEPLAVDNAEAVARLGSLADLLLVHDRPIETRCDDSVTRVIGGQPTVFRRARGYVPHPLAVARPFARPVLATGAHLKSTFCFGVGDTAHLGPHIGDLETEAACRGFDQAVAKMERFLGVRPEVIAHDLHPGYYSTAYALGRPEAVKIGVQHHHAHVASAMAEHGLQGPVLGVAYDGTGLGPDGAAWGGELLLADFQGFERLATFRPLPLAGGDLAIRQVWRLALALLDDAFEGDPPLARLPLFARVSERERTVVRQMIAGGVNTALGHGVGRYFDAFGAIVLGLSRSAYEGQVALLWNLAADGAERSAYDFEIAGGGGLLTVDLRPAVRQAVGDLLAGRAASSISARFHNTLIRATAELVREALGRHGRLPVVLTGGCFQNPLLAIGVADALKDLVPVYLHRDVPPGDGGIALGQAVVADAVARKSL
ncbi:MAG TPA: carbamoyltransferase HypF [Vicinamibacteria bacterium]|nr:carbamoyltransferase HypF [Vicinamibacteria bacterium]